MKIIRILFKKISIRTIDFMYKKNNFIKTKIAGQFPNYSLWSFLYLSTIKHNKAVKEYSPLFKGIILDVGCGSKPYKNFATNAEKYIGVDVIDDPEVDQKMIENKYIPFDDNYFDAVISTQAIEHIQDLDTVLKEIKRVAKHESLIFISLPFMFQEHGAPHDYRRFTKFGLKSYLSQFNFDIIEVNTIGGIGSYLIVSLMSWIEFQYTDTMIILRFIMLPLYLIVMPILNLLGLYLDRIDKTDSFYTSVYCLAKNQKSV
jgi:SAM-dependent methyltransferase